MATQRRESREDAALEIFWQRYDRGEINKEEFEAQKRSLVLRVLSSRTNWNNLERFVWPLDGDRPRPD
ncbi:MAG TPA: SHOCT domain-containing protein [Bacteroidota bacterium]